MKALPLVLDQSCCTMTNQPNVGGGAARLKPDQSVSLQFARIGNCKEVV
jgi:hypothetical protein